MKSVYVRGLRIDDVTSAEAVERALGENSTCFAVTPNAVMLDACHRDPRLCELLSRADLSLADGVGVTRAAKRQGTPLSGRVAGIEFGEALLARAARDGLRVFLLGGGDGVAEKAAKRLTERYGGLCICGHFWGYFEKTGEEDRRVISLIRAAKPDILLVCLGFPLQEEWIASHLHLLDGVRVAAGLGGALDVWSGNTHRAPKWVSKCGMEWAWRMTLEPKRLKNLPALLRCALGR